MQEATLAALAFAVLGLLVGSFLNVVILRLPVMLQRQWRSDSLGFLREQGLDIQDVTTPEPPTFNLLLPRSRCGHCGHAISALENIPVISYMALRGRCKSCHAPIGKRYPLVELATAATFAYCGHQWGLSWTALAWAGFAAAVIALIMIDWDTTLLPDNITLPLLWAGLLAAWLGVIDTSLRSSVLGAVAGYLSLWSVYWLFKLLTKKEGMGHGDFKLLAALGAWLGAPAILPIIIASSVIGALVGIAMKLSHALREGGYMPYGPFLGCAGLMVLAIGAERILGWMLAPSLG
ncbi:prepilin peptidase [Corticibacter populi]|uniref:prepilin peptidase n=1 Tax=Corticibacter populi TaxID=1550736 RepID=UPI0010F0D9ED|nr:A24 family peptidase [Corticibacter populi]RZS31118.1 type 4 prepilin peptidase 1 [Corticibacter populi]